MGNLYRYPDDWPPRGRDVSRPNDEVRSEPLRYSPPGSERREEVLRERLYREDGSVAADRVRVRRTERTDPYVLPPAPRGCLATLADAVMALVGLAIIAVVIVLCLDAWPGVGGAVLAVVILAALGAWGRA